MITPPFPLPALIVTISTELEKRLQQFTANPNDKENKGHVEALTWVLHQIGLAHQQDTEDIVSMTRNDVATLLNEIAQTSENKP